MKKPIIPYLMFDGNCREALEFYKHCFGGELTLMTYKNAPADNPCADTTDPNKIMHGMLVSDRLSLMASDNPKDKSVQGNQVILSLHPETPEETDIVFEKLMQAGLVLQPLHMAFWGAYFGMITDRFGIGWMFNCQLEDKE